MILIATDSKGGKSLLDVGSPSEVRGIIQRAKAGKWPEGDIVKLESFSTRTKQASRESAPKPAKKAAKKAAKKKAES
jgi:hypothetical protein